MYGHPSSVSLPIGILLNSNINHLIIENNEIMYIIIKIIY